MAEIYKGDSNKFSDGVSFAMFVHGYASIIANNSLEYDEKFIEKHLERVYTGAILAIQGEMKKLYEKNEQAFAIAWIVVYCVLQSLANPLHKKIGIEYSASAIFCILLTIILFTFIRKNKLQERYGLGNQFVPDLLCDCDRLFACNDFLSWRKSVPLHYCPFRY